MRARRLEGGDRLVRRQVPARVGVGVARDERRLAEEQVGPARNVDERVARRRVARVRERALAVGDAEGVGRRSGSAVHGTALTVSPAAVSNGSRSAYSRRWNVLANIDGVPNCSPNIASCSTPPGGTQTSGASDSRPSPNIRPHTQGTRSPQWSRCQCEMTIESSCGQPPSRSRSLASTPGPQSSE